jgi:hypothetical protein
MTQKKRRVEEILYDHQTENMTETRVSRLSGIKSDKNDKKNNYRKNEIVLKNFFILLTIFMIAKSVMMYLWEQFFHPLDKTK